uniref:Uncharacterized protein n=1 Tax=Citrobacter freundii TaxID=546 RepID=A0A2L0W1Q6_CITFR|nr:MULTISPECIES: hypothetical protein [Enterobacterales]AVA18279.1 Hypothetical protein [Citrobacter freundii]
MLNGGTFTPWLKSEQQPFVPDPGGVRSLFTIRRTTLSTEKVDGFVVKDLC